MIWLIFQPLLVLSLFLVLRIDFFTNAAYPTKQVELKQRFRYRLILDESYSFGVLGRTGRGVTEHQNVDPQSVDMLVGSLAHGICSGGGFCAGSPEVVDHQRISSSAYVFSAALPAMLAVTTSETLKLLEGNPQVLTALRENIRAFRTQMDRCEYVDCSSALDNPVCIFSLKREAIGGKVVDSEDRILMDIVDEVCIFLPFLSWAPMDPIC